MAWTVLICVLVHQSHPTVSSVTRFYYLFWIGTDQSKSLKMKKVIYLFALMFAMVLISTNCEKDDDPIIDEGLITLAELDGTWDFVSYNYDGTEYNCSTEGLDGIIQKGFYNLTFDKTNMEVIRIFECPLVGDGVQEYDFRKALNSINFDDPADFADDIWFKFTVLSYDGTKLKLRIDQTSFNDFNTNYLGGTLILIK